MVAVLKPRVQYTEALRSLRTALMQSADATVPPNVILVTSSVPGEGKTTMSLNLAIVFAQVGKRVLLVDTDLRTPTLQSRLGISNDVGLSSLLLHEGGEQEVLPISISFDGGMSLDIMPAGPLPDYPAELLASEEMGELLGKWRTHYDYVILDSAPVLPVTDTSLLTGLVDFTLVVARHNKTNRRSLERTSEILRSLGVNKTGIVLNGIKDSSAAHFSYYGYKQTAYYGRSSSA
jgi:polysaccharide biosynthesis transport protein